jgi:hypothetical protein
MPRWLAVAGPIVLLVALRPAPAAGDGAVLLPVLPPPAEITDEHRETATRAYADVERAWGEGDLEAALAAADESFAAVPNASTAVLRATVLAAMGRPAEAFAALLVASDLDPRPDERAAVAQGLATHGGTLAAPMGWARIVVDPPDAVVTLDDVAFRPPRTVGLSLGTHAVRVVAPGYQAVDATIEVLAAAAVDARYSLAPTPAAPPLDPAAPPLDPASTPVLHARPPGGGGGLGVAGWALVGGGVAIAAAGGGMHAWALQAADDTSKYAPPIAGLDDAERERRFDRANEDMKLRGTLAYVFYGVGGAAAVTGAVLLILDAGQGEPSGVAILPGAVDGAAGLHVLGRF